MDGGTLKLGSGTALGVTANAISVGSNSTATLDLNGQSIANAVTITGSGIGGNGALINSSATTATLSGTLDGSSTPTIGGTGNILISGQVIASGSSHLTKVGSNTVTFSNTNNTYTRALDINAGTLQFAKTGSISSSATTVASGATLAVNAGGTGEWTNGTSGAGTLGGLISGTGSWVSTQRMLRAVTSPTAV
jgi:autotransporter-associated beta strand protein